MSKQASALYEFGPFRVDPEEQQPTRGGRSLALPPKAFDTMLVLEPSGELRLFSGLKWTANAQATSHLKCDELH